MSQIPSINSAPSANRTRGNDLREVDIDQFLKLMIAELQNQDPLEPMDNADLVQQISQIREIGATNQLTETLEAVVTGQNLATAGSLIGRTVEALSDDGTVVQGLVDRVSISVDENDRNLRRLKVHVDTHSIDLNNIREIVDGVAAERSA